ELQLEVSTRENEERKERDSYIVQLNSLQGEKPAHCQQLLQLMQARLDYHSACARHLQQQLPKLQSEVARITRLSGPCYGTPLGDHLSRTGRRIAYVIDVCTAALRRDDIMDEEGLFRVNGPTSSVQKLESFLDVMQAESEIHRYDSASICGALKKYLKQLPEPLIGQSLLPEWKKACAFSSSDERRMALHSCCSELQRRQPQYFDNLRHLIKFLALVCDRQERNKMSPKNLGICIGPNIVGTLAQQLQSASSGATFPASASGANGSGAPPNYDDLHSANLGTLIVENLIVHHDFCFGSEAPMGSLTNRSQHHQQHHPFRRDSERSLGSTSFASSTAATSGAGHTEPGTPTNFDSAGAGGKFSTKSFHTDLYDTAFTLHALRSNGVAAAADAAATASSVNTEAHQHRPHPQQHQHHRLDRSLGRLDRPLTAATVPSSAAATATGTTTHDFVKQARSIFEGHLLKSASLGAATNSSSGNSPAGTNVDSPRLTRFKDLRSPPSDFAVNSQQQRLRSMSSVNYSGGSGGHSAFGIAQGWHKSLF
uniref:Rho-GAP domain-containing protein n=1 Tax=Macrostomum lignano TaxID=282301 RepID=A0A1I8H0L8_9PLAT